MKNMGLSVKATDVEERARSRARIGKEEMVKMIEKGISVERGTIVGRGRETSES